MQLQNYSIIHMYIILYIVKKSQLECDLKEHLFIPVTTIYINVIIILNYNSSIRYVYVVVIGKKFCNKNVPTIFVRSG